MVYSEGQSSDIGVLGGGPARYVTALRAAQLGAKVTLIEEIEVGGTYLNRGCIPTSIAENIGSTKSAQQSKGIRFSNNPFIH